MEFDLRNSKDEYMFFARIVFYLNEYYNFRNLSATRINLFSDNNRVCTACIDARTNKKHVIIEYGDFSTRDDAYEAGTQLLRTIKLDMINKEIPINISGGLDTLDSTNNFFVSGKLTDFGKSLIRNGTLLGVKIPDEILIEDEYIGMQVFEVKESLREVRFVAQEIEVNRDIDFSLHCPDFQNWNPQMDIALSLLMASISINDIRVKLLLRLMSVEVLVSNPEPQDAELISAIDSLAEKVDCLNLRLEQKEMLKSKIGAIKEKSIGQKAKALLREFLPKGIYNNTPIIKFFNQCYKMRSSFLHSGSLNDSDIFPICQELKRMSLDLLMAISESKT